MPLTIEKFLELAFVCLNTYYAGWDNEKPAKYLIPKYPDIDGSRLPFVKVCEEDIFRILQKPKEDRTPAELGKLAQYNCKKAEARVCRVLEEIDDHFITIYNLQTSNWCLEVFEALKVNPGNMKMPDFIVLGPGFGVFLIEVKSGQIHPKGIQQLRSCEKFIRAILEVKFAKSIAMGFPIKKILVTVDLDKPSNEASNLSFHKEDYMRIFKEDLYQAEGGKSFMHDELNRLMSVDAKRIHADTYQYLAKILVGLRSAKPSSAKMLLIEPHSFQCAAVKSESILYTQISRVSTDQQRRFASLKKHDIIMSTPDHLDAIDGGYLQMITGPAGTGKTIVLLAKAIQQLEAGRQVVVISAPTYVPQYQQKFDDFGLKGKYKIYFYYALVGKLLVSMKFNSMFWDIVNKPAERLYTIFIQARSGGADQRPLTDMLDEVEEILKDTVNKIVDILPDLMKEPIFEETFLANGDLFMDDALISYRYDANCWKLLLLFYAWLNSRNREGIIFGFALIHFKTVFTLLTHISQNWARIFS